MKSNVVTSVVAIFLLLAAIFLDLPYDYYVLLRWVICGIAIYIANTAYLENKQNWMWIMGVVALAFNPIFKIYLSRGTWSIIDLITIGLFGASIFYLNKTGGNSIDR